MKKIFLFLLLFCSCSFLFSQDFSNKGKLFYITYPAHIDATASAMGIYITSDVDASGTVTVGSTVLTYTVTANSVKRIFLGPTTQGDAPNTNIYLDQVDGIKSGAAVKVTADKPVVVYAHIIRSARSAATLVLPVTVWGKEYIMPSYQNQGASASYGTLSIVASDSNTVVEITPSVASRNGARTPGTPFQITIPVPGDAYQLQFAASADLSGTIVKSVSSGTGGCKKIAVFSGTTWSGIGCSNASGGDNLYQQLFPTGAWGRQFLTAPFKTKTSDIVRVFVKDPTTVVTKTENGVTTTLSGLGVNLFYEYSTGNPTQINADKPISVVMYIKSQSCQSPNVSSDPEMIVINPVEQTVNNITVFSAHRNYVPANQSQVTSCYLNIILKTAAIASFKINNASPTGTFVGIPGTSYSYLQQDVTSITLTNPVQNLKADSSFIAIAYGFGDVESYGYNAGTNVTDLYQYVTLQNAYATVNFPATCKETPFKFSITLPYQPTSLLWDFNNNPNLTPNANISNSSPVADSSFVKDGRTLYVYKLPTTYNFIATGTYTIKVIANNPTSDGCSGLQEISYDVSVYDKPIADFTVTHSGCISDSARFFDGSNGFVRPITKWRWDFGDTGIDSVKNPVHKYISPGTGSYSVQLSAFTDIGCRADTIKNLPISSLPFVKFGVTDTICAARAITFTDSSTIVVGSMVKWYWDYGNGTKDTLTASSPRTITYPATGPYTVSLKVETNTGCTNVYTKTITVTPDPVVGFILPEVCLADAAAVFIDTSKIADNSESLFKYLWTFNAGTPAIVPGPTPATSIVKNGSAKYNKADNYSVSLKVTSKDGCMVELVKSFTVNGSIPVSDFAVLNSTSLCSNTAVQIQNTSTVDFGLITKVEIYWDYGNSPTVKFTDDDPQTNEVYSNLYTNFQQPASKTITIRFVAYSGGTCSNIKTRTITLNASPKVQFVTMPGICLDATARQITQATETGGVAGASPASMYYGTGVSSAGLFTPTTSGVGTFPIKYVYTSDKGCKDSAIRSITVWPSPTANFGFSSPTCERNDITFTDTSIANFSNIVTWQWDFGNSTSLIRNNANPFTKQYPATGTYNVVLKVITDSGCVSPIKTKPITINHLPIVNFSLPEICLPDGNGQFNDLSTIPDGSESLFSYRWDFADPNDPSPSTIKNPIHKYSALAPTGGYQVKLKVTSKDGCVDSLTQSFSKVYPQPKANFTATPLEVCLGDTIHFADLSNGMTSAVNSWNWDFGDGTKSTLQNPYRIYADSGTFVVNLFIYNTQNCVSDTLPKSVIIHPYPVLDAGPDLFVLEGGTVRIKTDYYATNPSFLWSPSIYLDSDTVPKPSSSPANDITYSVKLTGIGGCSDTSSVFIKVLRKPVIPNAFSPNGDGINDTWRIEYLESYPGATVEIFDRGGRTVFSSFNYTKDWDGKINGKSLPVGTYYYIINPKNGRSLMSGYVTIIK